ncbi:hypothetical protein J2848_005238 [Azospirillum lipoferum]|uniref:Uncharacterized protein n=1 Tax=Azospirillum lipoferum TaxID=193 RepID=A0A5A9GIT6_AZOLI|nr:MULTISPECIES: hypothetical protein [Azospirillum]KAA0593139.1 hypothetical protein FZ942_24685 [Azospirillum lipoferum]MCP1613542.1 hypothetical protein [Azospirillum lipoferum]MDW5532308.1 hypothetical protein [Azospirillum sp. NL1]
MNFAGVRKTSLRTACGILAGGTIILATLIGLQSGTSASVRGVFVLVALSMLTNLIVLQGAGMFLSRGGCARPTLTTIVLAAFPCYVASVSLLFHLAPRQGPAYALPFAAVTFLLSFAYFHAGAFALRDRTTAAAVKMTDYVSVLMAAGSLLAIVETSGALFQEQQALLDKDIAAIERDTAYELRRLYLRFTEDEVIPWRKANCETAWNTGRPPESGFANRPTQADCDEVASIMRELEQAETLAEVRRAGGRYSFVTTLPHRFKPVRGNQTLAQAIDIDGMGKIAEKARERQRLAEQPSFTVPSSLKLLSYFAIAISIALRMTKTTCEVLKLHR